MTEQQLQRGDVVACGGRYFVVWKIDDYDVEAFPIRLGKEAIGRHLVEVSDLLASWNISSERGGVSAGEREALANAPALRIIRVGRCSGGLICRIVGAAARAYAAEFIAQHRRCASHIPNAV